MKNEDLLIRSKYEDIVNSTALQSTYQGKIQKHNPIKVWNTKRNVRFIVLCK